MPKEKIGKIIKKIKVNKNVVVLYFDMGEKIEISKDAYTSKYLFVGKELSKKDIDELNELTSSYKLFEYALKLLSKGHYSEWKIREKLYKKEANKEQVDSIIIRLKKVDLINDSALAYDYVCYAEERNIGKNKIKKDLANKGIFEGEINKISFTDSKEKKKAINNIPSLEKKYSKYSYKEKKRHIYSALISRGFDSDIALYALNKISNKNDKDEKDKLKADYKKVYDKYKRKYEGRELKEKVILSLRNKGYKFSDINKMVGEDYDF